MNRLDQKYRETVVPALMKKFEYKSVMEVPCIDKVVINMTLLRSSLPSPDRRR